MDKKRILGFGLILVAVAIIASNISMTGAVIGTTLSNSMSFIALVFLVVGLGLMMARKKSLLEIKVDGTGRTLILTNKFKKAIRMHNIKPIQNAISNIGTGKGKEEMLKHSPHKSVRGGTGFRVLYDIDYKKGETILIDYSNHYE